jgi:hypothetical protein
MRPIFGAAMLGILTISGCGGYEPAAPPPAQPGSQAKAAAAKPAPAPAAPSAPAQSGMTTGMTAMAGAAGMAPLDMAVGGPSAVAPAGQRSQPQTPPAVQPNATYQKADVGAGKRGRNYEPGIVTTPIASYFASRERIAFQIQIPDAMRLYKASNGNAPKTHDEFMQKIIKENNIQLPDLPAGQRYVYLPDKEELFVEHPQ